MWILVCRKHRIKLQHDFQIHLNALLTQFIMWLQLRSYALCLELYKQALFQETLSIKPLLILSEGSLKQYWPGYFCQHLFIPSDIFFLILSLIPEIKASCMKVLTMHSRRGKSVPVDLGPMVVLEVDNPKVVSALRLILLQSVSTMPS